MNESASQFNIHLDRDVFLRTLVGELSSVLQDVVGLGDASGYISVVGQTVGNQLDAAYRADLGVERLTRQQVAQVLVDLKQRIQGRFYVIEETDDRIVFGNSQCPFEEKVVGRPSMCMMTSNVFGAITAKNLGYAKVELQNTIADGDGHCRVIVHLRQTPEAEAAAGREYFNSELV